MSPDKFDENPMKYRETPVDQAEGAVLARDVRLLDGPIIPKGTRLGPDHVARLLVCCVTSVFVVHPEPVDGRGDDDARSPRAEGD